MKKNLQYLIVLGLCALSFTTASILSNPNAPRGYTGAPTAGGTTGARNCTSCHGDFSINTGGGSVSATGLPVGTYTAGTAYNFSITVKHGTANRTRWGFAIKAVNTVNNNVVGTFSTTNANASVKGSANTLELSHSTAPSVTNSSTYTFNNLKWTAPAVPITNETNIKFYIVGVAGDVSGDEAGDYVHSATVTATLSTVPVTISSFKTFVADQNTIKIQWTTQQETNVSVFDIERSNDGINWNLAGTVKANGTTGLSSSYIFSDNVSPFVSDAIVYYRIKIIDVDGTERYSSVRSVTAQNKAISIISRSAMPLRPGVQSQFDIYSDVDRQMNIMITDMSGRIVSNISKNLTRGANTVNLQMPESKGIYKVQFVMNGFEKTINQIIQ